MFQEKQLAIAENKHGTKQARYKLLYKKNISSGMSGAYVELLVLRDRAKTEKTSKAEKNHYQSAQLKSCKCMR